MEKNLTIPIWLYVCVAAIAAILLIIGIILPDKFSMYGIPGLGAVFNVILLYLIVYIVWLKEGMKKK